MVKVFCILNIIFALIASQGHGVGPLKKHLSEVKAYDGEHAACYYAPQAGDTHIQGINTQKQVKLASVTKLLTTQWVLSTLGPFYTFKTKVVWDGTDGELFLQGDSDPFFSRKRLFLLISNLNQRGITQINKVYFDKRFRFFHNVEHESSYHTEIGVHGGVGAKDVAQKLFELLNRDQWTERTEAQYQQFVTMAQKVGLNVVPLKDLRIKVTTVEASLENPFLGRKGLDYSQTESPPIMNYLKIMNMHSMNYPADELFEALGGKKNFNSFIQKELGLTEKQASVYTGSGLPTEEGGRRMDSKASCTTMIKVLVETEKVLRQHNLDLPDVMMVGGVDQGTLTGVYEQAPYQGAVVAKTGTLSFAVTLSGFINTKEGRVYFGVFLQTRNLAQGRVVRNKAVLDIAREYGSTKPLKYNTAYQFLVLSARSALQPLPVMSQILP